jgi:DNA-binding LytR/AlgR family response regulator
MSKIRTLIVDDEELARERLRSLLSKHPEGRPAMENLPWKRFSANARSLCFWMCRCPN